MLERQTGKANPTLTAMPQIFEDVRWVWAAWASLHRSRSLGFAEGPIPLTEILAYCQLNEVDRPRFLAYAVQEMDVVYLHHVSERVAAKRMQQRAKSARQ